MAVSEATQGTLTVKAYQGDMKTLLAFNFSSKKSAVKLAGFTLQCAPPGTQPYYLQNNLRFQIPGNHAQDPKEPEKSSINAPIHKFRWLHVPGSIHQGANPVTGRYTYTVTPRYFNDKNSMLPIDRTLSASVSVMVSPFEKNNLALGFTRGFTQSQAFDHHFGKDALIQPQNAALLFDTSVKSGTNPDGQAYTFAEEYEWLGFTARERIFDLLNEVVADKTLHLDMCAYDLNEPDLLKLLLTLAGQGRIRLLLDNSSLHHNASGSKPEDQFEKLFVKAAASGANILRGHFGRYAHDKVMIVSKASKPVKVLTGSTNFSVTGLYVNSNHVMVFSDKNIAKTYAAMFEEAWQDHAAKAKFAASESGTQSFAFPSSQKPKIEVTFAPHEPPFATAILDELAQRIKREGKQSKTKGSVLFAVMELAQGTGPVYPALTNLHKSQNIFSYGISDSPGGIYLYPLGKKTGVLVTGKPGNTVLPPPFDQVRNLGLAHQVHHKFVVCGFNGSDPVVYCGSSNLALGGEENNGDNLLAIHDSGVATVFALEALALVDHFNFLDRMANAPKASASKRPSALIRMDAAEAGWFLSTDDKWTAPYFDPSDLHSVDRNLFA